MDGDLHDAASWRRAARAVVARHVGPAATIDTISVGETRAVFRVASGATQCVAKLATAQARPGTDYHVTAAAQRLARQAGVPVAEVIAVGELIDGAIQYILQEQVDGSEWRKVRPLLRDPELVRASAEIAQVLLTMQSIRLPSFGSLDERGAPTGSDLVGALHERISLRIRDEHHRSLARQVVRQHAELFVTDPRSTLTHDDLHRDNLLFRAGSDGWHLVAVLDWDKAWAGPAESDLARMTFWDDMTDSAFCSVYRASVPAEDGWVVRAKIYQLLWCLEYEATTTRHLTDTARLLIALT